MSKTTGVAAFCGPYGDGEGSGKATTAHPSIQQAFQQRLSFMPRGGPRANSGGRREGAGRKPGSVWAPKVSEWRACAAENAAAIVGSDRDPLIYLIDRVFDETQVPLNWSFVAQDILWKDYASGALDVGNGISAMPSLHVGGATLCALLGCRTNERLGIALGAYAVILMIGSVHLGWHYAIDGYVAVLGTLAIWWAVGAVLSRSGTMRLPDFRFHTGRDRPRPLTPRR